MKENIITYSIKEAENKSIRIKVTEKCPWDCKFCHKEGGWDIDDIKWDESTKQCIETLKNVLQLTEIHYTGGEPTSNRQLEELTAGLISLGLDVKTTSNAQFSETRLKSLMNSGLKSFNFSVHGLQPEQLSSTQNDKSLEWAEKNIERQKRIISKTIELGGKAKMNTVICSRDDIQRGLELYNYAKTNGIMVRFLNDLNGSQNAIMAITELAEKVIGAVKFKEKIIIGSSSKSSYYRDSDGYEFVVKEIRDNKLKSLCDNCQEKCIEQFYGIRLEKKKNKFYIRLCIDRHDGKSYMPIEEFLESEQLQEIIETLNK